MDVKTVSLSRLYLGTGDGFRAVRIVDGDVVVHAAGILGNAVRDLAVHPDDPDDIFVGCGLRGWGLHRSTDGGETFREVGFEDRWVWGVTRHPEDPGTIYIGTEPPMLYRSTDDGSTFEAFDAIDDLPSRDGWMFFHEPFHAGHVHGIAIHPDRPDHIYAGIEHGALIHSPDAGETWREGLVGSDLHRVAIAPDHPNHVLAGTGNGLYHSRDGGHTWERDQGLGTRYVHSIQFDPFDPDRLVVYAAGDGAPLYLSEDGGDTWTPIGRKLPAARPADNLRFLPDREGWLLYAGDEGEDSQLYASDDNGATWMPVGEPLPKIWRVEVPTGRR